MAKRESGLQAQFGGVLRAYRERAQLSQEALADLSGLHRTYISQLERGLKSPSLTSLDGLAQALGVKPHQLVKAAERRLR